MNLVLNQILIYLVLQYLSENKIETIFNSDDNINIKYEIGKVFWSRKKNIMSELIPISILDKQIDHIQQLTMEMLNLSLKWIITDTHIVLQKHLLLFEKYERISSRSNVFF